MNNNIKKDRSLQLRMVIVFGLLMATAVGFSTLMGIVFQSYLVAILVVLLMISLQFIFGRKIALAGYGAKIVDNNEYPELHSIVTRVSQQADIEKPDVAVSNARMMNAFAAGRSESSSVVCVTSGLMNNLNEEELEAVIAHEVAHIRNSDVAIMTAAGALLALTGVIMRSVFYSSMFGRNRNPQGLLLMFVVSLLTYIISFVLLRALSRYREYVADRSAAMITGKPLALAEALSSIDDDMDNVPKEDMREAEGVSALMISPVKTKINSILKTHPDTQKRINKLEELSKEMN